jgi:DNA-directed RNA polymerase subunit M/transcription elongation factor TFIIS
MTLIEQIRARKKVPVIEFEPELTEVVKNKEPEDITVDQIPDGPYRCAKCGSRKVITSQEQIRSGDEGATTVYNCQVCRHSRRT